MGTGTDALSLVVTIEEIAETSSEEITVTSSEEIVATSSEEIVAMSSEEDITCSRFGSEDGMFSFVVALNSVL